MCYELLHVATDVFVIGDLNIPLMPLFDPKLMRIRDLVKYPQKDRKATIILKSNSAQFSSPYGWLPNT